MSCCAGFTVCIMLAKLLLLLLSRFSRVWPHRRQPTRLPHPRDSPGKNTGVGCHCLLQCIKVKSESEVAQSCLTPSDPMDCSLPGSSVHGIFPGEHAGVGCHCLLQLAKLVVIKERFQYLRKREFPGRLVVKTLHFHCREHRFDPWSGKLWSCMPHGAARKIIIIIKKKEEKKN